MNDTQKKFLQAEARHLLEQLANMFEGRLPGSHFSEVELHAIRRDIEEVQALLEE